MKNGKKPTVRQAKFIQKSGFDPHQWMVAKDTSTELLIVAKNGGGLVITLSKNGR